MTLEKLPAGRHRAPVLLGLALLVPVYTYVGYPLVLAALAWRRSSTAEDRPAAARVPLPRLSVVVPARDEERVIEAKIRDVLAQDYPAPLEVLVVADGSKDATAAIARAAGARVLDRGPARGKSAAVNRGVDAATGEVVVLTDANCALRPGSLRELATRFADPAVAVAGGLKSVLGPGARGSGEGLYWRYEAALKRGEDVLGAVAGVPGELCAVRRSTFTPIPAGTVNDDYHLACAALSRGHRVVSSDRARATEVVSGTVAEEFERRTRIAAGTWQTTLRHLHLADPRRGAVALTFVSHRVLRTMVTPVLLLVLLVLSVMHRRTSRAARWLAVAQGLAYAGAAAGVVTDHRAAAVPYQFVLTNAAQLRGGLRHVRRRQPTVWRPAERQEWVGAADGTTGLGVPGPSR